MKIAVPNSRPKITQAELENIINKKGISIKDEPALISFRGYYLDSIGKKGVNDIEVYDDATIYIAPNKFRTFNSNTDPSRINTGLATLIAGVYKFYKGKHHPNSPNGYDALRSYPEGVKLPAIRDGIKSTCSEINIHKGGLSSTFSAGCQTIYPDQWREFIKLVYDGMTEFDIKVITYYLIEGV